jgi:FkbM family methyltransferase
MLEKIAVQWMSHLYRRVHLIKKPRTILGVVYKQLCQYLYAAITKFCDPIVLIAVGKKNLYMYASHDLPILKSKYRYYDTALPRICKFLQQKEGQINVIDVGANIGDTISLIDDEVKANFLCIEGYDKYFELLLTNTQNFQDVICEKVLVSDREELSNVNWVQDCGNAYLSNTIDRDRDNSSSVTTIDRLIEKHSAFDRTNLLKVDTEGYDYKVIRGAKNLLEKSKPTLYFEILPKQLISFGENLVSIFEDLSKLGYSQVLFYDYFGYPLVLLNTRETSQIQQLMNYGLAKPFFFFDALLFHKDRLDHLQEFYQQEMNVFPLQKVAS